MTGVERAGDLPASASASQLRSRPWVRRATIWIVVALATVTGAALLVTQPWARDRTYDNPESWTLVWSDDFAGTELDPTRWRAPDRSTFGEANLELACLMDRKENIRLSDGQLALTAQREEPPLLCSGADLRFPQGRMYSSAMVSTQGLASWQFGRIEIRAALPMTPGVSEGLWPALWLRPDDLAAGEIDIVEAIGTGRVGTEAGGVHQTIHYDYVGTHPKVTSTPALPAGFDSTEFHVYAVQLRPERIEWLVDGAVTMVIDPDTTPWMTEVLRSPYFLRMNLAVGGKWPGPPTEATTLPAAMRVDWVRVYQP